MATVKSVLVCFTVRKMTLLLFCISLSCLPFYSSADGNERPIIGIMAHPYRFAKPTYTAYIAASYVKYLESAGARVAPIILLPLRAELRRKLNTAKLSLHELAVRDDWINETPEYYKELFNSINGILFPGGRSSIVSSSYQRTAKILYDLAMEANKRGDFFPVWGTCLGFEQLLYFKSEKSLLSYTNTSGVALPLNFTNEAKHSRLFKGFPPELMKDLATKPLTENSHVWSLGVLTYNTNEELKKFYKVLSTNTDGKTEFVSTIEAYDYPIYGTQWHPEKNAFEWRRAYVPHSQSAVKATFHMAEFFVNEARKNTHRFESEEEESKALIYNYQPVMARPESIFEQIYLF